MYREQLRGDLLGKTKTIQSTDVLLEKCRKYTGDPAAFVFSYKWADNLRNLETKGASCDQLKCITAMLSKHSDESFNEISAAELCWWDCIQLEWKKGVILKGMLCASIVWKSHLIDY